MLTAIRNEMAITVAVYIILASFVRRTEGNNVTLLPNDTANVMSGNSLTLQCIYSGTYSPFTFNFYLNPDVNGILVRISNCRLDASAGYNASLYSHSCGTDSVNLTILMVSQADNGQRWECDVSFTNTDPVPSKDSTVIRVITPTTVSSSSSTTSTATTITMTTTTTTLSTANTEMRTTSTEMRTTNTEKTKTTNTGVRTTLSIKATSSCPVSVLAIIGIIVSCFLSILLIFIICCCCSCCCLYHYGKEQNAEIYEAKSVETKDNEDVNNHIKAQVKIVLVNAPSESSTSDTSKEVQAIDGTLNFKPETTML